MRFFCPPRTVPRAERGFTLVELMIVVAILSVVAVLAITSYGKYVRKAVKAEAMAMLGEIRAKEEAYFAENGIYLSTATDENTIYPAFVANELAIKTWGTPGGAWATLGVKPPRSQIYCGYNAFAGCPTTPTPCATNTPGTAGAQIIG